MEHENQFNIGEIVKLRREWQFLPDYSIVIKGTIKSIVLNVGDLCRIDVPPGTANGVEIYARVVTLCGRYYGYIRDRNLLKLSPLEQLSLSHE